MYSSWDFAPSSLFSWVAAGLALYSEVLFKNHKTVVYFLLRLALCVAVAVALPYLFESVHRVWGLMPNYYVAACVVLWVIFEISLLLLHRRHYICYLLFVVLTCWGYIHLHELLAMLDWCPDWKDLMRMQRVQAYYVSLTMWRMTTAFAVVVHLFLAHRERQEMLRAKLQAEVAMLKSQITPHFFFNSLNSIYSLALAKDDKAPDAIITLSDMMRYVLTDAKAEWIDLSKELCYLDRYVELQRLRLPYKTELDYQVEVDEGSYSIPPMLLITFFENAFKYGTSSQHEEKISIHLSVKGNTLKLATHNAIVVAQKASNSTETGIANARRRLELSYPKHHELLVFESAGYHQLKLTIQLS